MKAENERRSALLAQARGQYKIRGNVEVSSPGPLHQWSVDVSLQNLILSTRYSSVPLDSNSRQIHRRDAIDPWVQRSPWMKTIFRMLTTLRLKDILMALQNTHWDRTFVSYDWYPRWWENGTTHYHLWVPRCGEVNLNQVKVQSPYMIILTLKNST